MPLHSRQHSGPSSPRLYLVTPRVEDPAAFAPALAAALVYADVAAVLLRLADADGRMLTTRIKAIAKLVQDRGAALLLDGRPELVARSGADGVHARGIETVTAALEQLKPDRIVGAGGLATRHDAMVAGESGADYVMFGEGEDSEVAPFEAVLDRVAWWAEVFEIPCVAFARRPEEIDALARAGADFIAVANLVWTHSGGAAAGMAAVNRRLILETA